MRVYVQLIGLLFFACACKPIIYQKDNDYFFFFEEIDGKMRSYYNEQKHKKSYTYFPERARHILFIVKKDNDEFKQRKIKVKDTVGLVIKTYDWFNKFDNFDVNRFFYRKPRKNYFIIERDSLSNKLNLIEVDFIDEIE